MRGTIAPSIEIAERSHTFDEAGLALSQRPNVPTYSAKVFPMENMWSSPRTHFPSTYVGKEVGTLGQSSLKGLNENSNSCVPTSGARLGRLGR
jgi:hypothetical protein